MTDDAAKILVVDDEETLCEALKFNLEEAGYRVDVAYSAEDALALDLSDYALILLDIMMGDISGLQLASILKKKRSTADIPIIFCTAKDNEEDMVKGLDIGADDYIAKPYSMANVMARVRSVLRRAGVAKARKQDCIVHDGLSLLPASKSCFIDGAEVKLPRKEFEILHLLLSHKGEIISRDDILKRIWPEEVVVLDRVVDVNITRLRAKLGEYGRNIVTRVGYGYGFME